MITTSVVQFIVTPITVNTNHHNHRSVRLRTTYRRRRPTEDTTKTARTRTCMPSYDELATNRESAHEHRVRVVRMGLLSSL